MKEILDSPISSNFQAEINSSNTNEPNYKIALFEDITNRGSYEFTNMRCIIYSNGSGYFQIYAKGKDSTTFQAPNNNTGPHFLYVF